MVFSFEKFRITADNCICDHGILETPNTQKYYKYTQRGRLMMCGRVTNTDKEELDDKTIL